MNISGSVFKPGCTVVLRTKREVALDQLDRIRVESNAPSLVLADAGYGDETSFRNELRARGQDYALGVTGTLKVWRPDQGPDAPAAYSGRGRRPVRRYPGKHQPVEARVLATELPAESWTDVELRPGAKNPRTSRFARVRVRHAHRAAVGHAPGPEEWLVVEWPEKEQAPSHYFLVSLDVPLEEQAVLAKLRWRVERDYQDAKQEVGLDQYEGRRWIGFNHHLTVCMASMAYLVASRALSPPSAPSQRSLRSGAGCRRISRHYSAIVRCAGVPSEPELRLRTKPIPDGAHPRRLEPPRQPE